MIYKPTVVGEDTDKAFYELNSAVTNLKLAIYEHHPFFRFVKWLMDKIE